VEATSIADPLHVGNAGGIVPKAQNEVQPGGIPLSGEGQEVYMGGSSCRKRGRRRN